MIAQFQIISGEDGVNLACAIVMLQLHFGRSWLFVL